jgi:hypothetical protein
LDDLLSGPFFTTLRAGGACAIREGPGDVKWRLGAASRHDFAAFHAEDTLGHVTDTALLAQLGMSGCAGGRMLSLSNRRAARHRFGDLCCADNYVASRTMLRRLLLQEARDGYLLRGSSNVTRRLGSLSSERNIFRLGLRADQEDVSTLIRPGLAGVTPDPVKAIGGPLRDRESMLGRAGIAADTSFPFRSHQAAGRGDHRRGTFGCIHRQRPRAVAGDRCATALGIGVVSAAKDAEKRERVARNAAGRRRWSVRPLNSRLMPADLKGSLD